MPTHQFSPLFSLSALNRARRLYSPQRRSLSEVSIELVTAAVSVYEGFQLHSPIGDSKKSTMVCGHARPPKTSYNPLVSRINTRSCGL